MVALGVFQALLNGIGWILAWIYDVVGNFGVSIIVLTILIRVVLLPLGIKQIKSMQAMQAMFPASLHARSFWNLEKCSG